MSLVSICANASGRMGLEPLTNIVANTNGTAQRLFRLANESGRALLRRHNWQELTKLATFDTVANENQPDSSVPDDFDHIINETVWNRSTQRQMDGPLNAVQWARLKGSGTVAGSNHYRVRTNVVMIHPTPPAGEQIAYEYVTKLWVATFDNPDVGVQTAFQLDTDVSLLDEEMLTVDLIWRYRASAGLNYAEAFRTAELTIADRISHDGGRRTIDLARGTYGPRVMPPTIPDGDWLI